MFLILYARIVDNKKNGLDLEGPFYGPECHTMSEAHDECRKIVTPSKDHILIKIFDLEEFNHHESKEEALRQFERTFECMESAQILCDSPKRKRK